MKGKLNFTIVLVISVVIFTVTSSLLSGCAKEPAPVPPAPAPTPAPAWKWPESISIITSGVGTSHHSATASWAPELEKSTGTKVRVVAESASAVQARWVNQGTFDIWTGSLDGHADMVEAKFEYAAKDIGPVQVAAVWSNGSVFSGITTSRDSNIKSWKDIKPGTKYALWTVPVFKVFYQMIVAYLGFTAEQLPTVPCSDLSAAIKSLGEGKADIQGICSNTSPLIIEQSATKGGIRYISFPLPQEDPEGMKRARQVMPTTIFGVCPKGFGHESGWGANVIVSPMITKVRIDANPDLVYNFSKWLDENYASYKDKVATNQLMSIQEWRKLLDFTYMPVHEGTIRYLKEKKLWTEADDARQKYNVKLLNMYTEAFKTAVGAAEKEGIKIDPKDEKWMSFWDDYKKKQGLPRLMVLTDAEIKEKLASMK